MAWLGSLAPRLPSNSKHQVGLLFAAHLQCFSCGLLWGNTQRGLHGQQWNASCSSLLSAPVTAWPLGVLDCVLSHVLGKTAVPLGKVIQKKEAERNLHGINLWSTEKAKWKTGCCHSPYPVLGTFEYLSQAEPFLHNRRPDCDEKSQHVWTGQLEADSHPELSCGFCSKSNAESEAFS